jgi:hypothetical protein
MINFLKTTISNNKNWMIESFKNLNDNLNRSIMGYEAAVKTYMNRRNCSIEIKTFITIRFSII